MQLGDRSGRKSLIEDIRVTNLLLTIIVVIIFGAFLKFAQVILFPFTIAVLLFFVCRRIVNFLVRKLRVPHVVSIVLVVLSLLASGVLVGMLVYSSGRSMARLFPLYQEKLLIYIDVLVQSLRDTIPALENLTIEQESLIPALRNTVVTISSGFMGFVGNFATILFLLFFMLLEEPYLVRKASRSWSEETRKKTFLVLRHVDHQIGNYLSVKVLVSFITAVLAMIVLLVVGQDFPFLWAALIFFFNFIPVVGSVVITLICVIFSAVQFLPDWQPILIVGLTLLCTQIVIGNIIDPKLMGDKLNLSPILILFSLLCWGWLWGIPGMFLAVPLTLLLKVMIMNVWEISALDVFFTGGNA